MKKSKMAFIQSAAALLVCISMLAGTTFAWFTDSVTSAGNIIRSGVLDVEMFWADGTKDPQNAQWQDASTGAIFDYSLWEPGYTEVRHLKIENRGNLALEYQLRIVPNGEVSQLADVIDVYHIAPAEQILRRTQLTEAMRLGSLTMVLSSISSTVTGSLEPGGETTLTLALKMQEDAGNQYQGMTIGSDFSVVLLASQGISESDSFGPDYDAGALFEFPNRTISESICGDVTVVDGKVADDLILQGTAADARIPAGVQVADGTSQLTLTVSEMVESSANITLSGSEDLRSLDVHMEGIAAQNRQPMEITIRQGAPRGLNEGNLKLYHVENGQPVEMTAAETFTEHNQFRYDPATGDVILYMSSFSEVALVADTENPWRGHVDTGWYQPEETSHAIANADQLAGLGALVCGGNDFAEQTLRLLCNVNMGGRDAVDQNGKLRFYPIGYTAEGYQGAFCGTFDGGGHTVRNIFQNTWMMTGDYDKGYYNEAMGLFGYVYGGTVQNLTVDQFVSEGEYAPTGCVAAYAADAVFENIAVTRSHPATYNTSVAAVVGREGKNGTGLTFRNITVDSSNTVSALWGSYDVGAAGLLGYLGPDSTAMLHNCNVSATMDVYNDVCGNYQYYWYRYCGMLIGTVDKTREDGSLDLSNITATGCTVNFGDRHEYYYCEFERNSQASYTEDFQFSRVPHSELNLTASPVTCTHPHTDAEDKQAVYLPFYQLFGGYGWGVDGVDLTEYNGLQIEVDRQITVGPEDSADKFLPMEGITVLESGRAYKLGQLFSPVDGADIHSDSVTLGITDLTPDNGSTVTYVLNTEDDDWRHFTVTFTGADMVDITIQDYHYCNAAALEDVQIVEPNVLVYTEEFLYGSYFDHDRFPENTGTRLTTGDYIKIRSHDSLLPAQDITIRVKDTNLTDYKVTLGYFDKDGVYTGRTGILTMTEGELTITAAEMRGAYFRVNVYLYNGKFTKVPETARIVVYGEQTAVPDLPDVPDTPTDPTDPTEPTEPDQPGSGEHPWEGKKITVLGDSISTGGWTGTVANLTGATLQNLSVSGKKLAGGLTSTVEQVAEDADLVIVFGGTNDYWHKNTSIGAADSTNKNTFVGALRHIHTWLKTNRPNAQLLFVFPADQTFQGNACTKDFGYGTFQDFRDAFLNFCTDVHVPYVDLEKETDYDCSKHSGDGVHPNSTGHQIIANAIYHRIASGMTSVTVTHPNRLLANVTKLLPESGLAAAPGVVFSTAPYAYTDTTVFAGMHITRIGIPVKSVKALDENQTFTLSVVKTTSNAYSYVNQYVLKLPVNQLGSSTTVNKWIYVDLDLQLAADETLAFGSPTDTVSWGYLNKDNSSRYYFRSANSNSWSSPIKEAILFDVTAAQTLTFVPTDQGLASISQTKPLPNVLTDFPGSAIAGGNPVEFTNPPYSYTNQDLFAGKHITRIGVPVKSALNLDADPVFTLSVVKKDAGISYNVVSEHKLTIPLESLNGNATIDKWMYWDLDLTLADDETLAFGGKNDTISWAWKSGFSNNAYAFRDCKGGTTKGIFFDITAESVLTYEAYLQQHQAELEQEKLRQMFSGKVISILGDSISTFGGYIPVADGFNLAHRPRYPQDNLLTNVNETWWMQTITALNAKLGINDSWAGSTVCNTQDTNSGDLGPDAAMASMTRIRNLGSNGSPDVILFYGGTNDIGRKLTPGSFSPATAPSQADLTARKWNTAADAYVAAIMRTQHLYPDALMIALLPTYTSGYYDNAVLAQYNAVYASICAHYDVPYIDLRECGITVSDLPDGIHPNAKGMDDITKAVLKLLADHAQLEKGENVVHSVTHKLIGAKSTNSYYKGVTHGKPYSTTVTGEDLKVTVTMDGIDITADCYHNGEISIPRVTGDLLITATAKVELVFEEYMEFLPQKLCSHVNLWNHLTHIQKYYTSTGWGYHNLDKVRSVTFDIQGGDRLTATSFGAGAVNGSIVGNGSQTNGIRVTFFFEDGTVKSMAPGDVYQEFSTKGCLTAPEGAVAVNVPMWIDNADQELYLLGHGHIYENGSCSACGAVDLRSVLKGKGISILGDSISTFQGWSNGTGYNSTIGGNAVYYTGSNYIANVSETWWKQTIDQAGLTLVVNNSWSGDEATNRGVGRAQQLHNNAGKEPDIIAVYLGINDFRRGRTVDAFRAKYEEMITGMLQKYQSKDVYLFTLLYTTNMESSNFKPAEVVRYNEVITQIAEEYGCTLVDIYTGTGITATNLKNFMGDGNLHPNCAGMDLITDCFLEALEKNYSDS